MTGESPRLVTVGMVGATPIQADTAELSPLVAVKVLLTQDYSQLCPVGWPSRPGETGASTPNLNFPRLLPAGTVMAFLKPEAAAIIQAGAGYYP